MKIAVKSMSINQQTTPSYFESTLEDFFVTNAHQFKENPNFSFTFANHGATPHCAILEGGCQFSFDRNENEPILCIGCRSELCRCPRFDANNPTRILAHSRYSLQAFTSTRIVILDVDQNNEVRRRSYGNFGKYHTLNWDEEQALRKMETRLQEMPDIVFFYRTKCNGFRIGIDARRELSSPEEYEKVATKAKHDLESRTPDEKLGPGKSVGDPLFHIDRIDDCRGIPCRSLAYWSYPRVYHPIWLNPNRAIK